MRTAVVKTLLTLTALVIFSPIAGAQIPWQTNLRAAHSQAEAQGKLLLLHFYSDDCIFCDRLEAGTFRSPEVGATINQRFIPVKIHGGKNPQLIEMFKVKKYPTDVIVTPGGQTVGHAVSPQQPNRYISMLTTAVAVASGGTTIPPSVAATAQQPPPVAPAPQVQAAPPTQQSPPMAMQVKPNNTAGPQVNQFVAGQNGQPNMQMPGNLASGTPAQLASTRHSAMNLSPAHATSAQPPAPTNAGLGKTATPDATRELAMQGFCAVTVIKEDRWVEGNPKFGVVHLGKLYLFRNAEMMQTFLADPVPYTPVLNEIDVVRFFEERKIVQGKREWGLKDPTHNRMFFFADEAAMNHFWREYERYTGAAMSVMENAIREANPGT